MRKLIRSLLLPPATDVQQLLSDAQSFPRYKEHEFEFRGMKFRVTDFLSVAWQLKEYFEDERMNFNSKTASPVIYDCGSNAGVSVIYFRKKFPSARIMAFEPDASVMKCLQANLISNTIEGVTLSEKAVWINNDYVEFGLEGADGGSVYREGNKLRVPAVRLKDLLDKEEKVDCLKMDIEGAETEVLIDCGNSLSRIQYLFVEYHSWKSYPQKLNELLQVLSQNGFRYQVHSIGEQSLHPFTEANPDYPMDVQLDIYAINTKFKTD